MKICSLLRFFAARVAPLFFVASTAVAGPMPPAGQYQMDGGTYSITLAVEGANLVVNEPTGKRSVYTPAADGSFHYRNPTNGILYGLRPAGDGAIEAFKPGNSASGATRLVMVGGNTVAPEIDDRYMELAEQYRAKAQSDSTNVQVWTACSAVAMKRAVSTKADADRYAREMANMLKQMSATSTPCADVLPANFF